MPNNMVQCGHCGFEFLVLHGVVSNRVIQVDGKPKKLKLNDVRCPLCCEVVCEYTVNDAACDKHNMEVVEAIKLSAIRDKDVIIEELKQDVDHLKSEREKLLRQLGHEVDGNAADKW